MMEQNLIGQNAKPKATGVGGGVWAVCLVRKNLD